MPRQVPESALLRRAGILSAAQRLWSVHGYHGVSLRTIARASGVTLALIDHHFGSKPQLLAAVINSWQPQMREVTASLQALGGGSGSVAAVDVLRSLDPLAHDGVWRNALCMAHRHCKDPSPEVAQPLQAAFAPLFDAFAVALARAYPGTDRPGAAWALLTAISAIVDAETGVAFVRTLLGEGTEAHAPQRPAIEAAVLSAWDAGLRREALAA